MLLRSIFLILTMISLYAEETQKGVDAFRAKDYPKALVILSENAEKGDATAQSFLGHMYKSGIGTNPDYTKAARLFFAATKQGEPRAAGQLSLMYFGGKEGIERDFIIAYALAEYVEIKGDIERSTRLKGLYIPFLVQSEIDQAVALAKDSDSLWKRIETDLK